MDKVGAIILAWIAGSDRPHPMSHDGARFVLLLFLICIVLTIAFECASNWLDTRRGGSLRCLFLIHRWRFVYGLLVPPIETYECERCRTRKTVSFPV